MKGKDEIKDLFSDKLGGFEAPVRPELWTNIASQIGTTSVVASTGMSLLVKSIIGVTIAGAAVVTTVLLVKPNSEEKQNEKSIAKTTIADNTIDQEPVKENQESNQTEIITPKPVKETINKVQKTSPEPKETFEIDQDQNFKPDISLISPLKEKTKIVSESKEEKKNSPANNKTVNKTPKENINSEKENSLQKTVSIDEEIKNNQNEERQIAYSLGELPNVFTPNGDGNNDILFIESEGWVDFTIVVLDAKQKVLFESNDPNFKWNGLDKAGSIVPEGSYGYYIIARDKNGNKVNKFVALEIRL